MKKGVIVIILLVFLLAVGTAISKNNNEDSNSNIVDKVDKEVEEKLKQEDEVSVIVVLEDDYSSVDKLSIKFKSAKNKELNKKLMIEKQQNKVLSNLNYERVNKKSLNKNLLKIKNKEKIDLKLKNEFSSVNGFSGKITKEGLEKLRNDPNVKKVDLNYPTKITLSDTIGIVNATNTWRLIYNNSNITGKGETICIIDTGIDYTHPDLGGCTTNEFLAGNCNKVIGGYDIQSNDDDPLDENGHGTYVAGVIAANGTIVGIAPDSRLVAIKDSDSSGGGTMADLISGIEWCTNNASKFNISVISISSGCTTATYSAHCDDLLFCNNNQLSDAVANAVKNNISVIAATGNDYNTNEIASPACIRNVTSVGATDKSDNIAFYSNRNSITDLFAPGSSIITTKKSGGSQSGLSGTSFSAPHVSAAFALLRQFKRLESNLILTPTQIQDALNDTGKQITDSGGSELTFSRINIFAAIESLDTLAPEITFVNPTPENYTNTTNTSIFINITSDEVLKGALLEWNGTNQTMFGVGQNWYINKTQINTGTYFYRAYGNDSAGNIGVTETRQISVNSSCIFAIDNINIVNNTTFCRDTYNLPNGITIGADNVVLDCNGSVLKGASINKGIYLENKEGITIKNCDIRNYTHSFYLNASNNNNLINNSAYYSNRSGYYLYSSNKNNLTNNSAIKIGDWLTPWDNGFWLVSSNNNTLNNNVVENSSGDGFRLHTSSNGNLLENNLVIKNKVGVYSIYCNNNNFTNNKIINNSEMGFEIWNSNNSKFINNNVSKNGFNQIDINSANIFIVDSNSNLIKGNFLNYSKTGIYLSSTSSNSSIFNNSIIGNSLYNLNNNGGENIIAEYNYWGFIQKTQIENNISGTVDFNPWYLDSTYTKDSDADNDGYSNSSLGGEDCNDADASIYPNATEIRDEKDNNCDGIIDESFTIGNTSNITSTTITANVTIGGFTNTSKQFNETQNVTIKNDGTIILEFKFNFTNNALNFTNIQIEKQNTTDDFGALLVKGISVQTETTKTIYLDNISLYNGVCIKDAEVDSIDNITNNCNGTYEYFLDCPGSRGQYNCTLNGSRWKIQGLNNSGVKQMNDTQPPVIISYSPTTTTSTSTTLTITTDENSTCKYSATSGINYSSMINAFTDSDTTHSASVSTSSSGTYRFYVKCNDTYNNFNIEDYNVSIIATISTNGGNGDTGGSSGGSSGGGGGGGGGAFFTCNMDWKCDEWSDCIKNVQLRDCNFVKVAQHTQGTQCPEESKVPETRKSCEDPKVTSFAAEENETKTEEKNETESIKEKTAMPKKEGALSVITGAVTRVLANPNAVQELKITGLVIIVLLGIVMYRFKYKKTKTTKRTT